MARKKVEVPEFDTVNEVVETLTDPQSPVYEVIAPFSVNYFGRVIEAKVGDLVELDDWEYNKLKDKVK